MFSSFSSQQAPTGLGSLVSMRAAQGASWVRGPMRLVHWVKVWLARRAIGAALSRMNERLLQDIGLSQAEIPEFLKAIR